MHSPLYSLHILSISKIFRAIVSEVSTYTVTYVNNDENNIGHLENPPQLSPCLQIQLKITKLFPAEFLL